jgi:hypothetical protein
MPTEEMEVPIEVTQTLFGVDSMFDLPLIVLAILLAVAAAAVSKRRSFLLLAAALVCLASKHAVFYLNIEPTPILIETQRLVGTLGLLLLAVFAGVSIRRPADLPLATAA